MTAHTDCDDVGLHCPFKEKVETVFTTVIAGNGEGPIKGRVKQLEIDVAEILPILTDLKTSADRQEGRDQERLDAELRRDKSWARFRQAIVTITTVGMMLIALLELNKQIQHGLIKIPSVGLSTTFEAPYTATVHVQQYAGNSEDYTRETKGHNDESH